MHFISESYSKNIIVLIHEDIWACVIIVSPVKVLQPCFLARLRSLDRIVHFTFYMKSYYSS